MVPLVLDAAGLVYIEVSAWDASLELGLAEGSQVCHGAVATPPQTVFVDEPSAVLVRWLPPVRHALELASAVPTSAVVTVSVVTPGDLVGFGMSPALANAALQAADHAWTDGHAQRSALGVLFSLSSTEERFWMVELATGALTHRALCLMKGVGPLEAPGPRGAVFERALLNQTSLGLFRASETYTEHHGRSLRLDGLEPGLNDLARDRAIVMHGAEYARVDHIAEWGYLGRSHGCPALDDRVVQSVIDDLHDGGLLYAWGGADRARCCTLRAGTEASPDAPYLPDPLGLVSIY